MSDFLFLVVAVSMLCVCVLFFVCLCVILCMFVCACQENVVSQKVKWENFMVGKPPIQRSVSTVTVPSNPFDAESACWAHFEFVPLVKV